MLNTELVRSSQAESKRLMIVLHGLGDSMDGYRWLPRALRLPEMNYLLVDAPDPYGDGFSWYDIYGVPAPGILRSRELLFQLLDHEAANGFPTEQTCLFGFSQGCLMTIEVGLRYPRRFAALIGVSGYVHELETTLRELSPLAEQQHLLLTHGTQDPLIPIAKVRDQIRKLQQARLSIRWQELDKAHTIAGVDELDLIREFMAESYANADS